MVPMEFGLLSKLKYLYLGENNLTGNIPPSLTNMSKLNELYLEQNQLSGHVPWEIGTKLTSLQILSLWGNQLSGNIPNSIGNCSNLTAIDLDNNQLSGMVPMELGKLSLLQRLNLHSNQLVSGSSSTLTFLTALTNCSHLEKLNVADNYLNGVFPLSIGLLSSKLFKLDLSDNNISGSIPQQIANLTNLTFLDLSNNIFSGNIPSEIIRFHKLERLYLDGNRLEGSIPSEMGEMKSLGLLSLARNKLSGKIPDSLCSLPQLRRLYLDHNYLSGGIPASLEGCQNLELLDLSYNKLRGRIPRQVIASLKNLQFYLNLSWNSLDGSLPGEISKIVMAQAIDISGNQLHGMIPNAIGDCTALEHLNLSRNAFESRIPDTISKLQNLQEMDLSVNFLSGSIPLSLRRLKVLRYMNLSFNNLSGQIPGDGLFQNSTVIALLMGNRGLCGPQNYSLPACPKQSKGNLSLLRKTVLSAVGIIAFILCSLIVGLVWRQKFSRRQFRPTNYIFERLRYPKFSYQDLLTATNGFDEANLLGVGNFGSVYRGNLTDGKVVAIKTLDLQNEEAHKSFKTECKVLGRIRHRNLTRIISAFSYPNLKGLVLQFASNGSLEKQLYPDRDDQEICELGLSERLKIAIDVAHGMEYLHHDCSPQVVHCDLKPGNVLLDSDMTALVTDFGISRLTTTPNTRDLPSTTTIALKGSIGYIAPEYGVGGSISTKGDVYSYGILILEMVTRKRPSDDMFVGDMNLPKWVRSAFPERITDIVDGRLLRDANDMEENRCLVSFINVGLICSSESPRERPSMRDVARALESVRASVMGRAAASNLTATISDLLRNTTRNPIGTSASNTESCTL
ncbi:hypothetical protein KI387_041952 [Taxus chinensis]|uniref:non-specific serine/threonine protein kinase n=1 Tax=Taxus chinensis TaxID=29808 RepID=A0AA38C4Z4_TAXCH|nr:hypothetical protein KI387_041952 [Taxus chinensis]